MVETRIRRWLENIGLDQYADTFEENRIDLDILPNITDTDLEKIAIPLGDRIRLLNAIGALTAPVANVRLDTAQDLSPVGGPARVADQAEQRQLTVMFADLVGSTPLSERLDLEQYYDVLAVYLECCDRIVRDHQGFIAQYQGDCVLAYFGFPWAAEDDAERAVTAGLAIVKEVTEIQSGAALTLQSRVGIATGVVLVSNLQTERGSMQRSIMGETPNLAARLQAQAEPGTVVVSDATRRLLGQAFICEDLGSRALRGFSEPVRVWQVRGLLPTTSRFEGRQRGALTPFVGRREELTLLLRRWRRAKAGHGQVVLLAGEPGIGKSRLAQVLHGKIPSDRSHCLHYQCSPHHTGSPLHPVIAQLSFAAGFSATDTADQKLDKLEALVGQVADDPISVARIIARLLSIPAGSRYEPVELVPTQLKDAILACLLGQLTHLAKQGPVLILFEDLHWIDPTSQEFLDLLIDRIGTLPMLLICTCRPEYTALWTIRSQVTTLNLTRLDGLQSAGLVYNLLAGNDLPTEVAQAIVAKTDGIPLFLEELTKSMLESGSLTLERGAYRLVGKLDDLALPSTLQGSLLARLDRLPGARSVAPVGAAIGRTFSYALLEAVAGLNGEALVAILKRLIDAELLFLDRPPPDATYTFKHALVRDAAYETLLKSKRRTLHAKIATTLEERFPELAASQPEVVAHHYTLGKIVPKALEFWRRAAATAIRNSANVEAIAHIQAALAQNEQIDDSAERTANEIALREMLCVPLEAQSWGSPDIDKNLSRLRTLIKKIGDRKKLFSVLHGSFGVHHIGGRMASARKFARLMVRTAKQEDSAVFAILSEHAMGMSHFFSGELQLAGADFARVISFRNRKRLNEVKAYYVADPKLVAYCMLAWTHLLLDDGRHASRYVRTATRLAEKHSQIFSKIYAFGILASFYQCRGEASTALHFASQAIRLSQEHNIRYWEAWAQIVRGWALVFCGEPNRGIADLIDGIGKYEATGSRLIVPYARALLADAYRSAGRISEGLRIIHELEDAHATNEVRFFDNRIARIAACLRDAAG